MSIKDNKGYSYGMSGNDWIRNDAGGMEAVAYIIEIYKSFLLSVKDHFSEFTYTENNYVANQLNITIETFSTDIVSAEITFENKNLASVKLTTTIGTLSFEKFGTTTITLPTDYLSF